MANPQTIPNINGSARVHLEAVKMVDNASKLVQGAVQKVSAQQQKLVESILQVIQAAFHDARENQLKLDSKLADVILMRIASLLDGFKSSLADSINIQAAKKEILDKLEDVSEGFFSKFIKQYLAQQIVNLIQDPATKDDIEDLKLYLDEVFQNSKGERNQEITVDGERREIAEEAAEAVADRQQVLEDRRQKRYEATIDNVSSGVTKLLNSIRDLFTNKVVPAVTKDAQTSAKWQRYTNSGFQKVNDGIQTTAQYLKKNVSPQFGILKGVMLTAVLAPILSIGKDILGSVAKYALMATGIMFIYNFFKQKKGFFDYLTSDALGDLASGWKGIFSFLGDVGSSLWDIFGGLLDPIFKKIGEWLEPKLTEWINKFISKLDIGKLAFGSFGDLTAIAKKVADALQPIAKIMDDEKISFFEAVIKWWDSDSNTKVREKVERKIKDAITTFIKDFLADKKRMQDITDALKQALGNIQMPDLSGLTSLLDVLKPLAEEFKKFYDETNEILTKKLGEKQSVGDLLGDFVLQKFGLDKATLSKAVQNIADLDVKTINEKISNLKVPDLSGVNKALETVKPVLDEISKLADGKDKKLTLASIMNKIWGDFIHDNSLDSVVVVLKGLADEISPYMMEKGGGFSGYLTNIINSVMSGIGINGLKDKLNDVSASYDEAKKDAAKSGKNTWQTWFEKSGLKAALLAEIPDVISKSFKSFLETNPGMKALVGDNGLVIKLNNLLDQYGLGKPKEPEKKPEEDKGKKTGWSRIGDVVGDAVKGVKDNPSTTIISLINQILTKLEQTNNALNAVKNAVDRAMAVIEDIRQKLSNYKVLGMQPFKELGAGTSGPTYNGPQNNVKKTADQVSFKPAKQEPVVEAAKAGAETISQPIVNRESYNEENNKSNAQAAETTQAEAKEKFKGLLEWGKKACNYAKNAWEEAKQARESSQNANDKLDKQKPSNTVIVQPSPSGNDATQENNKQSSYYDIVDGPNGVVA